MLSAKVWMGGGRRSRALGLAVGLAALPLLAATPLAAQNPGQVTGTVTNLNNSEPLVGAQVVLVGTGIGTVTNNVGRYLMPNVPAGEHTLQVQLIGYATAERTIGVRPGETLVMNVGMRPKAVELESVIVTGTAGAARQREIGNSISQVESAELQNAPILRTSDAIQGRALGVTVLENSGQVGTGSSIRLRGNNSITFSNEPLIYVDGVRVSNDNYFGDPETNQAATPFDDLNPADIERVEVVKGAAATTLYGTEAAGGVIQIFTKRGAAGAPAWQFGIEQGFSTMGHIGPDPDVNPTGLGMNDCTADPSCPEDGDWFKNGHIQQYNLSVRGGSDRINYFVSSRFGRENGVIAPPSCVPDATSNFDPNQCEPWQGSSDPNGQTSFAIRGNFGFQPRENLTIQFNNSWSHRDIQWIPDGNNAEGFLLNIMRGDRGYTTNHINGLVLTMNLDQQIDHFITGVNFLWNPVPEVDQRLSLGLDYNTSDYREERPWNFWYNRDGNRETDQTHRRNITIDYSGTWRTDVTDAVSSNFSWGGQLYDDRLWGANPFSSDFAGPGDKLIQSGATTFGWEYRRSLTSGGLFFQEQVGYQDRLFLTAGVRFDGFSTFGEGFGLATYPKFQASYLVSDYAFWPAFWNTMKLRFALGESGKAPGAFDAERVWEATSGDEGQPGVIIANLGNPDLGPEVTRETEFGFDASMFDDRVGLEFTYYKQRTFDGLIGVQEVPSDGVAETQLTNVGEYTNTGIEAALNLDAVRTEDIYWSVGGRLSTNKSRILDMGGLESIYLGWRQYLRPCQAQDDPSTSDRDEANDCPIPGYWHDIVQNPDEVGVNPVLAEEYLGPSYPTFQYGLSTTLTLFNRLTLDVLGEGAGGHVLSSGVAYQNVRRGAWPPCDEIQAQIDAGNTGSLTAGDLARCHPSFTSYGMWVDDADFFKIRSASLSYRVPDAWLPAGTRSITLRVAARNLLTITDYVGIDPESFEDGARSFALFRQEYYNLPPATSVVFGATVNF